MPLARSAPATALTSAARSTKSPVMDPVVAPLGWKLMAVATHGRQQLMAIFENGLPPRHTVDRDLQVGARHADAEHVPTHHGPGPAQRILDRRPVHICNLA